MFGQCRFRLLRSIQHNWITILGIGYQVFASNGTDWPMQLRPQVLIHIIGKTTGAYQRCLGRALACFNVSPGSGALLR